MFLAQPVVCLSGIRITAQLLANFYELCKVQAALCVSAWSCKSCQLQILHNYNQGIFTMFNVTYWAALVGKSAFSQCFQI